MLFCLQNPLSWPQWMRDADQIITRTPDASGESAFPRFIVEPSGGVDFLGGKVPGANERYSIILPGKPSPRTFGIGYSYECDVEEHDRQPKAARPQKLTATSDWQRQTKTTNTQTNTHTHTHTHANEQVVKSVTLIYQKYVVLAKYVLHAEESASDSLT